MKDCYYCNVLNEEKTEIEAEEVGFHMINIPIHHCPYCGEILDRYKKQESL